jgi:hypothetical protein
MIGGNAAILNHLDDERRLRVFWGVRSTVQHSGEYELAAPDPCYETTCHQTRR